MKKRLKEKYSKEKVLTTLYELRSERADWEQEWQDISEYLLPGRGVYQVFSKPQKRELTSPLVINTIGEDSLYVLTSGMHGRLTSPAMPWYRLEWSDPQLQSIDFLKAWLQQSQKVLDSHLHRSNFYSIISNFYIEYCGFGNASMFVGEAPQDAPSRLHFDMLTAGEYYFSYGAGNLPNQFLRTIYMSKREMVGKFGKAVSQKTRTEVERNEPGVDRVDLCLVELVQLEKYKDKKYIQVYYEVTGASSYGVTLNDEPLKVGGFYEFPYPVARWSTIGSDVYGIGPGSRALPDIKRLQEMEKAFMMAVHKAIDPPLNAPGRMRGKINSLPGGQNYYSNPAEQVTELYRQNFEYSGVSAAIERVEQRIQRNFFNDVFLTAARDPNASPLRTGQVDVQEQEKLLRLGPVVERLQSELFTQVLTRCVKLLYRANKLPPLDPRYADMLDDIEVSLVSPMALAQRSTQAQATDSFMSFLGQAAQFDPTILDNVNPDAAARQRADLEGVDIGVLRPEEEVVQVRRQRAEAEKAQQQKEAQAQQQAMAAQAGQVDAQSAKAQAEAGQILAETQQTALEAGL